LRANIASLACRAAKTESYTCNCTVYTCGTPYCTYCESLRTQAMDAIPMHSSHWFNCGFCFDGAAILRMWWKLSLHYNTSAIDDGSQATAMMVWPTFACLTC